MHACRLPPPTRRPSFTRRYVSGMHPITGIERHRRLALPTGRVTAVLFRATGTGAGTPEPPAWGDSSGTYWLVYAGTHLGWVRPSSIPCSLARRKRPPGDQHRPERRGIVPPGLLETGISLVNHGPFGRMIL